MKLINLKILKVDMWKRSNRLKHYIFLVLVFTKIGFAYTQNFNYDNYAIKILFDNFNRNERTKALRLHFSGHIRGKNSDLLFRKQMQYCNTDSLIDCKTLGFDKLDRILNELECDSIEYQVEKQNNLNYKNIFGPIYNIDLFNGIKYNSLEKRINTLTYDLLIYEIWLTPKKILKYHHYRFYIILDITSNKFYTTLNKVSA